MRALHSYQSQEENHCFKISDADDFQLPGEERHGVCPLKMNTSVLFFMLQTHSTRVLSFFWETCFALLLQFVPKLICFYHFFYTALNTFKNENCNGGGKATQRIKFFSLPRVSLSLLPVGLLWKLVSCCCPSSSRISSPNQSWIADETNKERRWLDQKKTKKSEKNVPVHQQRVLERRSK